jgi:hypothetical protein
MLVDFWVPVIEIYATDPNILMDIIGGARTR